MCRQQKRVWRVLLRMCRQPQETLLANQTLPLRDGDHRLLKPLTDPAGTGELTVSRMGEQLKLDWNAARFSLSSHQAAP